MLTLKQAADRDLTIDDVSLDQWITSEQTITVEGDCFPLECADGSNTITTTFKLINEIDSTEIGTVIVSLFRFQMFINIPATNPFVSSFLAGILPECI